MSLETRVKNGSLRSLSSLLIYNLTVLQLGHGGLHSAAATASHSDLKPLFTPRDYILSTTVHQNLLEFILITIIYHNIFYYNRL